MESASRRQIGTLQAGRGIAALAVVMTHLNDAADAFALPLPPALSAIGSHGGLGVDFFFVLSGFIIVHSHVADAKGVREAGRYLTKRLLRIYPAYLPVSLALVALYLIFPAVSGGNRQWGILTSLTLIPSSYEPALTVAWTLVHEMAFYAIFLLFYVAPNFSLVLAAWAATILVIWTTGIDTGNRSGWLDAFFGTVNLEFVAGAAVAWLAPRVSLQQGLVALLLGLLGAVAYFAVGAADRLWFGLSMALIVLGLVPIERDRGLPIPAWMMFLGAASYSLYLLHYPVISVVMRLTSGFGSWQFSFAACAAAAVGLGCLYHLLVERPALALGRGLLLRTGRRDGVQEAATSASGVDRGAGSA